MCVILVFTSSTTHQSNQSNLL